MVFVQKTLDKVANYFVRFPMQKANFLELLIAAAIGLTLCYFSYQHFTNFENDVLDCPACVIEKTNQTNEEKINRINELTIQIEEVQK